MRGRIKTPLTVCLVLLVIPLLLFVSARLFRDKYYAVVALLVAVVSCLPLFYAFERRDHSSKELVVLAVMIALSVVGRFLFVWLPGFKPVTALCVIAAVWLGKESGFVIGTLSALVSNFYFGQGPWTPFQMFAWGFLGFLAGVFATPLKKSRVLLCLYGALAGVLFSAVMDTWTVLWADGGFSVGRYLAALVASLPMTVEYAVSNIVFFLLLARPIGEKLDRIKRKYGLFLSRDIANN